ncbi:SAF domain-containing protein [Cellulomonas sp. PhB150]|uniref:SAF domain-containing protein n=1 Tax=Cellulomonas sp. PhB150 TaxID=2485188 RepID=UPI000F4AD162|nr:SAF domain-containing protein [Cellulomonas sp. PhB150]
MTSFVDLPPPLARRRAPFPVIVRALLWRWRALVVGLCLAVVVSAAIDALRPPPPESVAVVVAARPVAAGAVLSARDLRLVRVPVAYAPAEAAREAAPLVGSSTAVPLTAGTPLVPGVVVPDDLSGPPGTVVAAVRLSDPAVAALLGAGMRVDVLAATPEGDTGTVVASRALVLPSPARDTAAGGPFAVASDDESLPVLLAVAPDEVDDLAAASASALLSAVVVP